MKIKFWKYDFDDARKVVMLLTAIGFNPTVIGGIWNNRHSNNDIDIYLPETEYSDEMRDKIMKSFWVKEFEITDWGSLYLRNTPFGTLDIFFKGQTDEFDY